MFPEKVEELVLTLEKKELDAPNGIVSAQIYAELFAAYLYKSDLNNARFLWKRIPQNIKNGNSELEKMNRVFQCLWNNDMTGFYKEINFEWSKTVAEIMFELKEKVQMETVHLIGRAYSSIFENVFAEMTNQTPEMMYETCKTLNWEVIDGPAPRLIIPKKPVAEKGIVTSSEYQLFKLTDFVSFLEN